jgi:hypothetical protein
MSRILHFSLIFLVLKGKSLRSSSHTLFTFSIFHFWICLGFSLDMKAFHIVHALSLYTVNRGDFTQGGGEIAQC